MPLIERGKRGVLSGSCFDRGPALEPLLTITGFSGPLFRDSVFKPRELCMAYCADGTRGETRAVLALHVAFAIVDEKTWMLYDNYRIMRMQLDLNDRQVRSLQYGHVWFGNRHMMTWRGRTALEFIRINTTKENVL